MRRIHGAAAFGFALLVATPVACSKSSTAPSVQLSQAQVGQLYTEISDVLSSVGASFNLVSYSQGHPLFALVPPRSAAASTSVSGSGSCPVGGSASFSGSADETSNPATFSFTASFSSCKTTDFTVNGSFNENGSINTSTDAGSITITGNISVTASTGSGSCPLNFTVTFSPSTATASGTICGQNVNGTV